MSRRILASLVLCAQAGVVWSQSSLGTKDDPVASAAKFEGGGNGLLPILQTILVLGVVLFLLKLAGPKILGALNKRIVPKTGSPIRIEESATFAGGTLYVVEARGKLLLLSVGANGVSCLADLGSTPAESERPPLFVDLVEQAQAKLSSAPAESLGGTPSEPAAGFAAIEVPLPETEPSRLRNDEIEAIRQAQRAAQ